MGLIVNIYKPAGGDCSNGGISSRCDEVTLLGLTRRDGKFVECEGPFEPTPERPPVMLLTAHGGGSGWRAVPYEVEGDVMRPVRGGVGPMMGGCYIATSDARFGELTGQGAGAQPIALHDRFETPAQHATYD